MSLVELRWNTLVQDMGPPTPRPDLIDNEDGVCAENTGAESMPPPMTEAVSEPTTVSSPATSEAPSGAQEQVERRVFAGYSLDYAGRIDIQVNQSTVVISFYLIVVSDFFEL